MTPNAPESVTVAAAGDVLAQEATIAARRARDAAGAVRGIPMLMHLFYTLDLIARDLDRAVDHYRTDS